jgi:hypothetical protein
MWGTYAVLAREHIAEQQREAEQARRAAQARPARSHRFRLPAGRRHVRPSSRTR